MEHESDETRRLAGELVANVWASDNSGDSDDSNFVQKAVRFAFERHFGQERPGGEPQVNHLLRVGLAAAEFALAETPEKLGVLVASGVLHDVLEDTPSTDEELRERFGKEVTRIVRALSHEEEEEPDEVYLGRVAKAGNLAVFVKRFDRLDNLRTLVNAPAEFRRGKLAEVREELPIWHIIDPEGSRQIEKALESIERAGAMNPEK